MVNRRKRYKMALIEEWHKTYLAYINATAGVSLSDIPG
jgi:hypothetical protein